MKLELDLNVPYQMRVAAKFLVEMADETEGFFRNMGGPGSTENGAPLAPPDDAPVVIAPAQEAVTELAAPKPRATRSRKAEATQTPAEGGANNIGSEPSALSNASPIAGELTVEEPVVTSSAMETEVATGTNDKTYTIDDVRNALGGLNTAKGLVEAKAALAEFKANRVSEVPEAQFGAFVTYCNGKASE